MSTFDIRIKQSGLMVSHSEVPSSGLNRNLNNLFGCWFLFEILKLNLFYVNEIYDLNHYFINDANLNWFK